MAPIDLSGYAIKLFSALALLLIAACDVSSTEFQPATPPECSPGRANCDGQTDNGCEADLNDAQTCGSCSVQCGGETPMCGSSNGGMACVGACEAPAQLCGGACVDVSSSPTNCGRCGRDCGGGACVGGTCQPVRVADALDLLDAPTALAVNDNAIFWTERARVRSCPLPLGCALPPTLIADAYFQLRALAVTNDAVFFTGCRTCDDHHRVYQCPVAGCPAAEPYIRTSLLQNEQLVLGKTRAFWRESTESVFGCALPGCSGTVVRWSRTLFGFEDLVTMIADESTLYVRGTTPELRTCPLDSGCAAPRALPNSASVPVGARAHGGRFYWLFAGLTAGQVRSCAISDCGTGSLFAVDDLGATELQVDGTGVYWLNPSRGTIRHCPLTGCPSGGPSLLASVPATAKALTLGKGFVYWIDGNTIVKVAKL